MIFKRISVIVLCICLAVVLVACQANVNTHTEKNTEKPTDVNSNKPTEENTEKPSEEDTEPPTQDNTEKPSEDNTEKPSEDNTEKPSEDNTEKPTEQKIAYSVIVEDYDYNEVEGAVIEIYKDGECVASGTTAANGKYTVNLVKDSGYTAKIVSAPGYIFTDEKIAFEDGRSVEFTVDAAVEYKIKVSDVYDGAAISGVTVELHNSKGMVASGITDANGIAVILVKNAAYTVYLSSIPEPYSNSDSYLLDSTTTELAITLMNPDDYATDGRDEEHPLIVYHRDNVTVPAGATVYFMAPRTPGFVFTIKNAANIKVIYNDEEFEPVDGIITVPFEAQLDDAGNPIAANYSLPNHFTIVNSGAEFTFEASIVSPDDHGGTEANPFELEIGVTTTTPEFILGTSLSNPGVSRYYYYYKVSTDGFFWIDSLDAAVTLFVNGTIVTDDRTGDVANYVLVKADDEINIHIESKSETWSTDPVSFIAGFEAGRTDIPDRFTCVHEYDNDCDGSCNICGTERLPSHTEEEILAVEPTCTDVGYTSGVKCAVCGEIISAPVEIPATGHTEEVIAGKDATCTEEGLTEGTVCVVCGADVVAQSKIPALGHQEVVVPGKQATCTEDGLTEGVACSVCGATIVERETISAKGHTETVVPGIAATCTESGLTDGKICEVCGVVIVQRQEIPALGHDEVILSAKEATCTETGLTEGKVCGVCGIELEKQTVIIAKGHTETVVPGIAATCTESGLTDGKMCDVCGETTVEQQSISALGHSWSEAYTVDDTNHWKICVRNCGEISAYQEHTYVNSNSCICGFGCAHADLEWSVSKQPTCAETGTKVATCTKCGAITDEEQIAKLAHTPGAEATCTSAQTCTVCGTQIKAALGHTPGDEATCTTPQLCIRCDYQYAPAKGHTPNMANATCTLDKACTVCGYIIDSATGHTPGEPATCIREQTCNTCGILIQPALGHTPGAEATCTTPQVCTVCGAVLVGVIDHIPGEPATCVTPQRCQICNTVLASVIDHTPGAAATCTTAQTCTVCGTTLVSAKGHTPGAAATCTTAQTCTVCGIQIKPALGHKPGAAATCKKDQTCTVCGEVLAKAAHEPNIESATCASQKVCVHCMTVLEPYKDHTPGAAATCTEAQKCTVCGWDISPALGHDFGDGSNCKVCGAAKAVYTYKITVINSATKAPLEGMMFEIYDFATDALLATVTSDANGYIEFVTTVGATVSVFPVNLPEGFIGESTLLGEDSAFGYEYTIGIMNEADYIYDGRDEAHSYNIPQNGGSVTVAANSTIYCMYPRSAGMTITFKNAAGIKVIYKGKTYSADVNGTITVKFDKQKDETGATIPIEYTEPCYFSIKNTTGSSVTLTPEVG
ncbi:MAG: hypothetical protein E7667_00890 [Ruminococcaceae bacterium]|nr:hypothetical protein [Oscillospiraceae bacterium]